MRKLLSITIIAGLTSNLTPITTCIGAPPADAGTELVWSKAFGQAVLDWVVEPGTNGIKIEVDWSAASWGIGAEILLNEPINLKDVAEIEAQVHTDYGSSTEIYLMAATADDANLVFPAKLAHQVTSVPGKFIFPVDKMVRYKPDVDSRDFRKEDWQRVDRLKFILTKPTGSTENLELITINNPRIVYRETVSSEPRREDPASESTAKLPEDIQSADFDDQPNQAGGSTSRQITKQPEIPDSQSLETAKLRREDPVPESTETLPESIQSANFDDQSDQADESASREIAEQSGTLDLQSLEKLVDEHSPENEVEDQAIGGNEVFIQKLFFEKIDNYKDCVQDWRIINDESKFFFAVNWKKRKSKFAINFSPKTPFKSADEWYLTFTARVINQSNPRVKIAAYNKDKYGSSSIASHDGIILKNKWKTFYVPLAQKTGVGWLSPKKADAMINEIEVMFLSSNPGLIKDDVVIIKDVWLIRK